MILKTILNNPKSLYDCADWNAIRIGERNNMLIPAIAHEIFWYLQEIPIQEKQPAYITKIFTFLLSRNFSYETPRSLCRSAERIYVEDNYLGYRMEIEHLTCYCIDIPYIDIPFNMDGLDLLEDLIDNRTDLIKLIKMLKLEYYRREECHDN